MLVIVVPDDRRMRIEVGYGLEGTLTDAQAARIIRDAMTPAFAAVGVAIAAFQVAPSYVSQLARTFQFPLAMLR